VLVAANAKYKEGASPLHFMTVAPTLSAKFLSVKTTSGLAKVLCDTSYENLGYLIYPSSKYREFSLKKKNGSERSIAVPARRLMHVQKRLAALMQAVAKTKPSAHGFVKKKSIVTNAQQHVDRDKTYLFNIDLKDFFPSISFFRVRGVFMAPPFSFTHSVATVLAHLCCWKGVLPQGAPTSPILSNLVCRGLDGDLQKLAHECRATYTRYADDISFSFTAKSMRHLPERIVKIGEGSYAVGESLKEIIDAHSFSIHPDKVRLHSKHGRMEVTGITVNEFPNVRREFVHQIRGMLHAWDKYGLKAADDEFQNNKVYRRQWRSGKRPRFDRVLWGKMHYLKMVKGISDPVYVRLARRHNSLVARDAATAAQPLIPLSIPNFVTEKSELDKAVFVIRCVDDDYNESQGTAFFLENVGVVTCEHVIRHASSDVANKKYTYFRDGAGGHIQLQDAAGGKICDLEMVFVHRYADLAVLKPVVATPALYLVPSGGAVKQNDVVGLVGFPDHKLSKSLSSDWGPVLTPLKKNGFQHFDIKPLIRVGNSGGPVLDERFRVIGVAKEGVEQKGGDNAILCISEVLTLFDCGIKTVAS
jgi:RNA-directed DNA polymerase